MSGRLEREPTEVGQAYVICSLCVSHTHAHTQARSRGEKNGLFEDGCHISAVMPRTALCNALKAWLSGAHCFYQHVCAESALEIIYGFKNTDIVHSFGVIL